MRVVDCNKVLQRAVNDGHLFATVDHDVHRDSR
jgi:hypothetical protein